MDDHAFACSVCRGPCRYYLTGLCDVSPVSSRMCERGTKGCTVRHRAALESGSGLSDGGPASPSPAVTYVCEARGPGDAVCIRLSHHDGMHRARETAAGAGVEWTDSTARIARENAARDGLAVPSVRPRDWCDVNPVSWRMCERGTKGCDVKHGAVSEPGSAVPPAPPATTLPRCNAVGPSGLLCAEDVDHSGMHCAHADDGLPREWSDREAGANFGAREAYAAFLDGEVASADATASHLRSRGDFLGASAEDVIAHRLRKIADHVRKRGPVTR